MATVIPQLSRRFTPRGAAVAELLTDLDALVRREVTGDHAGTDNWERDAERIAAEVATTLARLRDDLRRHPLPLRR